MDAIMQSKFHSLHLELVESYTYLKLIEIIRFYMNSLNITKI